MRGVIVATLVACCVLISGCSAHRVRGAQPDTDYELGYSLENGEVVFRFDPSEYTNATRSDDGGWIVLSDVTIETVCVAGDFNDWSASAWPMSGVRRGCFELRVDREVFANRPVWRFKFVVNGFYWVEPPSNVVNREPSGTWAMNRSYNLVLELQ